MSRQRHTDAQGDAPSFGVWLRKQRRALDLTQEALAQRVGCARVTIRRIEADELRPSQQLAELFAEHLGVPSSQRPLWLQLARGLAAQRLPGALDLSAPPAALAESPPTNLPTTLTSFLGRDQAITDGSVLLTTNRLLTLTGVGGTGKSRLALEMARSILNWDETANPKSRRQMPKFPDGVWWVELAPLTDPALIPKLVATVLGLHEQPGQPLERLLVETLKTKQMLLLLDNCEHLVAECAAWVVRWLHNSPHLRILATSREPLQLQGEQRLPVAPLAPQPAGELFVQRAQLVDPAFTRTPDNGYAIDQLCEQVDYLPLAIELLAARSDLFSPHAMLERLQARPLDLLNADLRNLPLRQRTLRHTIQHSYDLLSQREQSLFRTLGIFVGGADLAALAHFGFGEEVVHTLLQKSLIRPTHLVQRGPRVFLLETLREYAREQLHACGELAYKAQMHAAYYLALAQRAEPGLFGAEQDQWAQQLESEMGNLRTALTWWQTTDVEAALQMANALWFFWFMHDHLREGCQWLESLSQSPAGTVRSRAKATVRAAACAKFQGDSAGMAALIARAAPLAHAAGDPLVLGHVLLLSGNVASRQTEYAREQALYAEALQLFRAAESPPGYFTAIACQMLGEWSIEHLDFDQAAIWFGQSLRLHQQCGNEWMTQYGFIGMGLLEHNRGNLERAIPHYQAGLAITQKAGNKNNTASALCGLATAFLQKGQYQEAIPLFTEALNLGHDLVNKRTTQEALVGLATIARHQKQYGQAEIYLAESLTYAEQRKDRLGSTLIRHTQAHLAFLQADYARATDLYRVCIVEWQELAKPLWVASALRGFAMLAQAAAQLERALCLSGAEAALRQAHGPARGGDADLDWSPEEEHQWAQSIVALRQALADERAVQLWAEGQAMALDEAITYALRVNS
jgi:predicted ATPase/transcriptional regulator with XRE-family HTH domain